MKLTRMAAFLLTVLVLLCCSLCAYAEDGSSEASAENTESGADYDYVIKYGYKPLKSYDGAEAADYIKGKTPAASYVKAGENHVVSDNYYGFRDYVFIGWRCGSKLYQPREIVYNVSSDMTFIAEWARGARPPMTVLGILSYSKGGKVDETVSVAVGGTVTLKEGYWEDGNGRMFEGGSKFLLSFSTVDFTEAAKGGDTVSVKYDGAGVSGGIQSPFKIEKGGSFLVDGCYGVREGYAFTGWSDANGRIYTQGDTCVAEGNVVLTAMWRESAKPAPDFCTVTVSVGEGGKATPEGKSTVEKGKGFSFKVTADKGYKLISVKADGAEIGVGGEYTLTINGDMSINASFEKLPEEPSAEESRVTEESRVESVENSNETSVTEPVSKDDADKEDKGGVGKTVTVVVAVIICIGCIALAAWFSRKSQKGKKRK